MTQTFKYQVIGILGNFLQIKRENENPIEKKKIVGVSRILQSISIIGDRGQNSRYRGKGREQT